MVFNAFMYERQKIYSSLVRVIESSVNFVYLSRLLYLFGDKSAMFSPNLDPLAYILVSGLNFLCSTMDFL